MSISKMINEHRSTLINTITALSDSHLCGMVRYLVSRDPDWYKHHPNLIEAIDNYVRAFDIATAGRRLNVDPQYVQDLRAVRNAVEGHEVVLNRITARLNKIEDRVFTMITTDRP